MKTAAGGHSSHNAAIPSRFGFGWADGYNENLTTVGSLTTVHAGNGSTVTFTNNDNGVPHDWALFATSAATKVIGGATSPTPVSPGTSQKYSLTALQPGTYFYHCDFHPTTMTGTLVVK